MLLSARLKSPETHVTRMSLRTFISIEVPLPETAVK
jgi:hypothetical protein